MRLLGVCKFSRFSRKSHFPLSSFISIHVFHEFHVIERRCDLKQCDQRTELIQNRRLEIEIIMVVDIQPFDPLLGRWIFLKLLITGGLFIQVYFHYLFNLRLSLTSN